MESELTTRDSVDIGKREAISYPYFPLSSVLKIGDAVRDLGGNNSPVQKNVLASHLRESEKSSVLQQRISAARCFGIIEGKSAFVLTDAAKRYYFPTTESERSRAIFDFLESPGAFADIIKRFDGTKLPSREILANIFHRECHVPDSWKDRIASYFSTSVELAGALDSAGFLRFRVNKERGLSKTNSNATIASVEADKKTVSGYASRVNEDSTPAVPVESNVWDFSFRGKSVRLITPTELDKSLWEKLNAYVKLLNPGETDPKEDAPK